jgi:predicted MFS family arabinose efflux permease
MIALLAVGAGVSVANLYYAQPLLASIAATFRVSPGRAALVVTAAQVGYGAGLVLLVPLGDILTRRRLVPLVLVGATGSLLVAALAPSIGVLAAGVGLAGLCSVATQILVPFAAHLAGPGDRGRAVGTVMSGLLVGILLARTAAGLIAQVAGWRAVFVTGAVAVAALAVLLAWRLPAEEPRESLGYRALLRSVARLAASQPVLRHRAAIGAFLFAAFNVVWTDLAFLLAGPPYHYSRAVIGLFGLLGAGGAGVAAVSGRLADRGWERWATVGGLLVTVGAFGLLALGRRDLAALMVGILAVDLGIQAVHIQNQHLVFGIDAAARSRLNTAYMVTYFAGGAIGSAAAGAVYAADGWGGSVALGAAFAGAAAAVWCGSLCVGRTRA